MNFLSQKNLLLAKNLYMKNSLAGIAADEALFLIFTGAETGTVLPVTGQEK